MRTGSVKRAAALLGLTAILVGLACLTYPVSTDTRDCGSAVMRQRIHNLTETYPEECHAPIRRQRWLGGGILVLGTVIILGTGIRCLITPD